MNFAGKFHGDQAVGGPGSHGHVHVETVAPHAPSDAIIVPDAHLLFTGDFKRSGVDLILSTDDHRLVLEDYFKGEKRAALASPDGAHLTGDLVNALTGHVQYSQADGSADVAKVIGHVTKLTGTATATRNGVSIILNQGDNVNKGDVVQSGSDSILGITFIDGTVFGLSSNARMVLNEMVYDPNGSNNSSLLSLVQGTISFVAGQTAKHGDMKIDTPAATMGIRGTAVLVEIDFEVPAPPGLVPPVPPVPPPPSGNLQISSAPAARFQVLVEPDGTTGSYILFDKVTLAPLATVNQAGTLTIIKDGLVSFSTSEPLSTDAQKIITDVFALKFTNYTDPNPKTNTAFTDTITPQTFGIKLANGETIVPVTVFLLNLADKQSASGSTGPSSPFDHIPGAPEAAAFGGAFVERAGVSHSSAIDTVSGHVNFADINRGDVPTVTTSFTSFSYQDAAHNNVTAGLSAEQLADIKAVEVNLQVAQDPAGKNTGSAIWTYSVADSALDFLREGETLTLTYTARVDNNFAANNETTFKTFSITVTGTNDVPMIVSEADAPTQAVIVVNPVTPHVLGRAINTNSLGLNTETFDGQSAGSASNNGAGHGSFHSAALDATFTGSGNAGVVNGSSSDVTAAPFIGPLPGELDTSNYLSVGGGGTEIITFASEMNFFGLYWGSVDPYNTISFYDGDTLVASYTGTTVAPLFPDGNQGSFASNGYVEFSGLSPFNKVVLESSTSAFEIDNVSAGLVPQAHTQLLGPISGTLTVSDADFGDTLTASVIGNASVTYHGANGATTLPGNADVAALISASDVTFDTVQTNGGTEVLHWTYHPTDPDLDFLKSGDTLTISYTAQVNDGHGSVGNQPLTVTIVGADTSEAMSNFKVVSGTSGSETFNNVGGNATIFGGGGQDTFVFKPGFGTATIGDFDVNNGTISIDHTLVTSLAAFLASAEPSNSGHDTILTDAAHDTITLTGVTVAQIQAHPADFHLA